MNLRCDGSAARVQTSGSFSLRMATPLTLRLCCSVILMALVIAPKLSAQAQLQGYEPQGWVYGGTTTAPGTCDAPVGPPPLAIRVVSLKPGVTPGIGGYGANASDLTT